MSQKNTGDSGQNKISLVNNSPRADVFLGQGCKITGNLNLSGNAELGGIVEGDIQSKDQLTIAESAEIKAKISSRELNIKGKVTGDLIAKSIVVEKSAKISGILNCKKLSIEEGASIEGKIMMDTAA